MLKLYTQERGSYWWCKILLHHHDIWYLQLLWCHVWWNVKLAAELVFESPVWMIIPAAAEKFLLGGNHQINLVTKKNFNQTIQTRFWYLQHLWCHVCWNVKLTAEWLMKNLYWEAYEIRNLRNLTKYISLQLYWHNSFLNVHFICLWCWGQQRRRGYHWQY